MAKIQYFKRQKAEHVPITDSGSYYTGTEVETALAEIGDGTALDGSYIRIDTASAQILTANDLILKPSSDSTTAFEIQQADTTSVFTVDTTNARVGIGTNAPTQKLEIIGGTFQAIGGHVGTDATAKNFRIGAKHYTNAEEPLVTIYSQSTSGSSLINFGGGTSSGNTATEIRFLTAVNNTTTTGTTRLLIDLNGQIGINQSSPGAMLQIDSNGAAVIGQIIKGAASQSANLQQWQDSNGAITFATGDGLAGSEYVFNEQGLDIDFRWEASGVDPALFIEGSSGNVGIGTSSPDSAFHIKAGVSGLFGQIIIQNPADDVDANVAITAYESDGSGDPEDQLWYLGSSSSGHEDIIFLNRRNANLQLGTNGVAKMTILGNGNVGINVTDPDTQLEILNAGNQLKLSFDGTDNAIFAVDTNGDLTITPSGDGVGIGLTPTANMAGLAIEAGLLTIKETTAPTADTNYGKLWTNTSDELWFQDGAGANHLLHGDAFSEIWFHSSTAAVVTIGTEDAFTLVGSFTVVGHEDDSANVVGNITTNTLTLSASGGGEYEISYHASITSTGASKEILACVGATLATPKDITDVTDDTVSPIVITSTAHGFEDGDMVEIAGVLVNTAANGSFIVDNKTANTFEIVALDGTATTGNGDYDEGTPTGDVTIWYLGNMVTRREVSQTDLGSISATGLHILQHSDVVSLYMANLDDTTNVNIYAVSLDANRIGD